MPTDEPGSKSRPLLFALLWVAITVSIALMMLAIVLLALSIDHNSWIFVEAIGGVGLLLCTRTLRQHFGKRRTFTTQERKRALVRNAVLTALWAGSMVASLVFGFVFGQSAFVWVAALAALAFVSFIGLAVNAFNGPLMRGSLVE